MITIAARPPVDELHDCQPLMLRPDVYATWLDPENKTPGGLLGAVRADDIEMKRRRVRAASVLADANLARTAALSVVHGAGYRVIR
jgi:putative SOS response-associated peptidase YedK